MDSKTFWKTLSDMFHDSSLAKVYTKECGKGVKCQKTEIKVKIPSLT